MCNKELLVAYVYDDISDIDRGRFERHLRECAACREDAAAMRTVRTDLSAWTAPQPDLGFSIVRDRRPAWRAWTPAYGLAAAAVLVLAAAAALAHIEVTYGRDGVTIRTGWNQTVAASARPAPAPAEAPRTETARTDRDENTALRTSVQVSLTEINRRLHDLEASRPAPVRLASNPGGGASETEILRRVRDLLAQSESRQQQELALRIAQVIRDFDAQRVADLTRIQQGFGRIDEKTNAEAAAHRELANYILTSSKQQK